MESEGKETPRFMERVVYSHLGSPSGTTRFGPRKGLDNGVVSLGGGRVMILTADPISAIREIGMNRSAWLSVHLIASDYTTSGFDPEYAVFSYNFPSVMTPSERAEYVTGVGDECKRLGISIIAGHTGSYPGGGFTVIGAGTMLGFAPEGRYITPSMARVGDVILMSKTPAIEATLSLVLSFPKFVEENLGTSAVRQAKKLIELCSVVKDARVAREVGVGQGGVSSMHDATEGGILGALEEMASASSKSFAVEVEDIPQSSFANEVCSSFGLDPLATMGEGSLLMTCEREKVSLLVRRMAEAGISVAEIGEVARGSGLVLRRRSGRASRFDPQPDGYWHAYEKAKKKGLE